MESGKRIHIGIIPDGNRRWCRANNVPLLDLPKMLQTMFVKIIQQTCRGEATFDMNHLFRVREVSLYILSMDNLLKRGGHDDTIQMVREVLQMLVSEIENGHLSSVTFGFVGELRALPQDMQDVCERIKQLTHLGSRSLESVILCTLALAYDARIDCKTERNSQAPLQSDIDVVIRTGGEQRSSGFFPLQTLYSEWIYSTTLFPDMTLGHLNDAIKVYMNRERRFGA